MVTRSLLIGLSKFWLNNMDPIGLSCSLKLSTFTSLNIIVLSMKNQGWQICSLWDFDGEQICQPCFSGTLPIYHLFCHCCKRWKTTRNEIRKICRFTKLHQTKSRQCVISSPRVYFLLRRCGYSRIIYNTDMGIYSGFWSGTRKDVGREDCYRPTTFPGPDQKPRSSRYAPISPVSWSLSLLVLS